MKRPCVQLAIVLKQRTTQDPPLRTPLRASQPTRLLSRINRSSDPCTCQAQLFLVFEASCFIECIAWMLLNTNVRSIEQLPELEAFLQLEHGPSPRIYTTTDEASRHFNDREMRKIAEYNELLRTRTNAWQEKFLYHFPCTPTTTRPRHKLVSI